MGLFESGLENRKKTNIGEIQLFINSLDDRSKNFLRILYFRRFNGRTSFSAMKRLLHCNYNELCGTISNLSGYFRRFENENGFRIELFGTTIINSRYNGERVRSSNWVWSGPVRGLVFDNINNHFHNQNTFVLGEKNNDGPQIFYRGRGGRI